MSAWKRNQENAISARQQDVVQNEMLVPSATMTVSVEKYHNRPLLLQDRRHKTTGEVLRKGNVPVAVVLLESDVRDRVDITSKETLRIRHVIIGILPYVKATDLNRDASSAQSDIQAQRG